MNHQLSLDWLSGSNDPGVRYLALRDVAGLPPEDAELREARAEAHTDGPIAVILDKMQPPGFWSKPGPGYLPKYYSTVWSIILLAQLGARIEEDKRIALGCDYIIDQALTPFGQFSASGAPSGTADCLQGNLCWALLELGVPYERIEKAFDWMARTVTGEGLASNQDRQSELRYYAGKCAPLFACGSNNKQPCAWGGAKVLLAFSKLAELHRTPLIESAIQQGVDFFLVDDPAEAPYPNGYSSKPSGNWWKFGFPVFYVTDLLQVAEAMVQLGFGKDARLARLLEMIASKQDAQGRWVLEYDYRGKTWVDFGEKKQPNPWVTIRALRVLHAAQDA